MHYRRLPSSMPTVIRVLKKARDNYGDTPDPADRAITAEQFAQLDEQAQPPSLLSRVLDKAADVDAALAVQAPLVRKHVELAARLGMSVSHFHQVLDLGIARAHFAAGARCYYGRDAGATSIPQTGSYADLKEQAQKIVAGEAARQQAEGAAFKPMDLPSAAEVAALLAAFAPALEASQRAQDTTNARSEELMALYPAALALAVDICDTVEFFYRRDRDAASRRAKCVRWGVTYASRKTAPAPAP